jgi:hypothetical protein
LKDKHEELLSVLQVSRRQVQIQRNAKASEINKKRRWRIKNRLLIETHRGPECSCQAGAHS